MIVNKKRFFIAVTVTILIIALIGGLGTTAYLYFRSQNQLKSTHPINSLDKASKPLDDQTVISRVSRHMLLPVGAAKIITISGVEKLKSEQIFFKRAADGDKVLVFPQQAIIYRPSADIIVEVAQIKPTEK